MDVDTFLVTVYVLVDTCCQTHLSPEPRRPGPAPALSRSEVLTLALVAQWLHFPSEQECSRYAERHLRPSFPTLPHRSQDHRLLRRHQVAWPSSPSI